MLSIRMKLIGTCVILLGIQAAVVGLGLYELSGANTRLADAFAALITT